MHKVYTNIIQIAGDVITVEADDIGYMDIAEVTTRRGTSLAQVIRLDGKRVDLQIFAGSRGISTGDQVRFLGHPMRIASGADLLGRIFNGSGMPLDKGPTLSDNLIDIGGPPVNPVKRVVPNKMIRTGLPMIDIFNSLVESQKLPIFSIA
jgi:V/A-type H+-transporting ATPase subunit B